MVVLFQKQIGDPKDGTWEDYGIPEGVEDLDQMKSELLRLGSVGTYRMYWENSHRHTHRREFKVRKVVVAESYEAVDLLPSRA